MKRYVFWLLITCYLVTCYKLLQNILSPADHKGYCLFKTTERKFCKSNGEGNARNIREGDQPVLIEFLDHLPRTRRTCRSIFKKTMETPPDQLHSSVSSAENSFCYKSCKKPPLNRQEPDDDFLVT